MGTRSAIGMIRNNEITAVYKHWDGYPSSTGLDLQEFIQDLGSVDAVIERLLAESSLSSFGNINLPSLWIERSWQENGEMELECRPKNWAAFERLVLQHEMGERDFFKFTASIDGHNYVRKEIEKRTKLLDLVRVKIVGEPEEIRSMVFMPDHKYIPFLIFWYVTGMQAHSQRQFQEQWKDRDLITSLEAIQEMGCEFAYLFNMDTRTAYVLQVRYKEGLFVMAEAPFSGFLNLNMDNLSGIEEDEEGDKTEAWEESLPKFELPKKEEMNDRESLD